ncbi:histidinol-phosphate transaminase [cf. Phormidesmis sp. LEGE 11477]|uniref:histidinol-phosphate transaminase n=1 Tax=cf. Phormidesmis sp. LEGE 11477 TaxID=1828680 RepID=UPI00187FAA9C|nr:histidinol-phosphate transaminase [cf. Phormidesmis sp. LEGE 11477]MBE9061921.1 histidinol-phosphate transaminase [cf. Phormidesmis sp. LEGE 11477]
MNWFRPAVVSMEGYAPGEWPALDAGVLKLNSNENPYPPSPTVMAALANIGAELLRRYPDPLASDFRQKVSETFDIPADWIIAGNGSDDLLTLLVRACSEGNVRSLAYPMPTYVLYRTLAAIQPAAVVEVPYQQKGTDWRLPIDQLLETNAAVTLIATPNSPSGHVVTRSDLRRLAAGLSGVLLIDEAYVDFVGKDADRANLELVREFENVMLLRTLSKGYGLAGLRLGFGIARPGLLAGLLKVKDSYNVDVIALKLGEAAIADQTYKHETVQKVVAAREQLATELRSLGFLVWPSSTNFLLVKPPQDIAQSLQTKLKAKGIMIRYFNQPGLDDKLRITVGTPEQNARMVQAISCLL